MRKIIELFLVPKSNKIFISILTIIALISGSLFFFKLNPSDQEIVKTYIENLIINNEYNSLVSLLGMNFLLILIIYLFGFSIIGLIINLFIYFAKIFIFSIEITALIKILGSKGIIASFVYVCPHKIISIFIFAILVIYSINLSITFILSIIKKENINFSNFIKTYNKIFLISLIIIIVSAFYEYFLLPLALKLVLN